MDHKNENVNMFDLIAYRIKFILHPKVRTTLTMDLTFDPVCGKFVQRNSLAARQAHEFGFCTSDMSKVEDLTHLTSSGRRRVVHLPVVRLHALPGGLAGGHHALPVHPGVRVAPRILLLAAGGG